MLYSEIIAVCSQIHTKHINSTLCEQTVEFFVPNLEHICSRQWGLTFKKLSPNNHNAGLNV
jgi:hypothetical protein